MSEKKTRTPAKYARKPKAAPVEPLLSPADVQRRLHICRGTLLRLIASGTLPAPIVIGPRMRRWYAHDVEAAIESWQSTPAAA